MTEQEALNALVRVRVGDRIWFTEEKQGYTVQARSSRYIICNKPFNPKKTVLYTIIDLDELVRGPENLIFGFGAETREQCEEMLGRLEQGVLERTEVSQRHRCDLHVSKVSFAPDAS